jgi:polar amino acid transport system substrate-binding protein
VRKLLLALALVLALVAAGCGGDDDDGEAGGDTTGTTASSTTGPSCDKASLDLKTPGSLTIATDNPSFPPWFEGPKKDEPWDPTTTPTKKGYEAEVAYAVAKQLGFTDEEVEWTVVPFNSLFRPGTKDFDFDINQVSYSPERAKALDFSDSYYEVEQALVSTKGSKIAGAKTLAELEDAKLGAQIGTTSYDTITDVIKPSPKPNVYDTNNDAVSALKGKLIDGIVVDYPTSLYMANVQVPNGTIVGRVASAAGSDEHFGLVTEKGSSLVPCLNQAIAALQQDGTLDRLEKKWVTGSAPPVLQ